MQDCLSAIHKTKHQQGGGDKFAVSNTEIEIFTFEMLEYILSVTLGMKATENILDKVRPATKVIGQLDNNMIIKNILGSTKAAITRMQSSLFSPCPQ